MDNRDRIKLVLREQYGNFETHLEHVYENKLTQTLVDGNIDDKKAWLTYNQVILELKHSLKDSLKVKELQYKLTDNNNPNIVCLEVIQTIKNRSAELDRLYNKINNFI